MTLLFGAAHSKSKNNHRVKLFVFRRNLNNSLPKTKLVCSDTLYSSSPKKKKENKRKFLIRRDRSKESMQELVCARRKFPRRENPRDL
jgi:hypothetical protein